MGVAEHEITDAFVEFAENVSAIFQVRHLLRLRGADRRDRLRRRRCWRLVVFILLALLVARPAGDRDLAFVRSRLPGPQKAFIAWFGPKGVASMLFALLRPEVRRRARHRRSSTSPRSSILVLDRRPRPDRHRGRRRGSAPDDQAPLVSWQTGRAGKAGRRGRRHGIADPEPPRLARRLRVRCDGRPCFVGRLRDRGRLRALHGDLGLLIPTMGLVLGIIALVSLNYHQL